MKKTTLLTVALICGLLATGTTAFAQAPKTEPAPNWSLGDINLSLLGRDDIQSSKFQEYREVPKGLSMPGFFIKGSDNGTGYSLIGKNVSQKDQRYTGFVTSSWMGTVVSFDYNQIVHNMGNNGHSIETETAPGVWAMSQTLRLALQTAVDTRLPTSLRTYPFYQTLFAPTIADASVVNISGLREHGNYEVELGRQLPFGLKATYERDVKTGYRGNGGGVIYSAVNSIVELPESLDEVTQDVGLRATVNKSWGNAYATFAHNWYNNRLETTLFDNPLRATDQTYTAAAGAVPALGGPGTARLIGPPDNSANRGTFGAVFKFQKQTRVTADVAIGQWNQNAQLYPYTLNSTILNSKGVPANTTAALDVQSANGKINTTMLNFGFSSRPIDGLGLRLRYRSYDMNNKTPTFVRTGAVGSAPDRSWTALTASNYAADPLGYATAGPLGSTTKRFDAQASYDIQALTIEGTYRNSQIDRTYREATKGTESGETLAAIMHYNEWLMFRGTADWSKRTASGYDPAVSIGLQADESERKSTRVGAEVEVTPNGMVSFTLAYAHHNDDYPNRPNRSAVAAGTTNGLLNAKYDTYTVDADFTPTERADVGVFYTYEKDLSTTQTGGTGTVAATALASLLTFGGSNKTNTYGAYANLVLVPDKLVFEFNAKHQKVDGLMDIVGDPTGSFALARVAYGGIQDITDYNDTNWTTVTAQLRHTVSKSLGVTLGYAYEKYTMADAYSYGTDTFPAIGGFYLMANDGNYKANVGYVKMNFRF